eukprot:3485522-Pyramimonas_sp.AAC.1
MVGDGGKAHCGIVLDLLLAAKQAEGRTLRRPKAFGPPIQPKKKADPRSKRSRKLVAAATPTTESPKLPALGTHLGEATESEDMGEDAEDDLLMEEEPGGDLVPPIPETVGEKWSRDNRGDLWRSLVVKTD